MTEPKPTSRKRAAVFIKAALQALDDAGGSLPWRDVLREVEKRVDLNEHDRLVYEKTGYTRWQSVLHFYSIDCVKAGYIKKSGGRWYLTPEGKAILPLAADEIITHATRAYREWKAKQVESTGEEPALKDQGETHKDPGVVGRALIFESAQSQATQEIQEYVNGLGAYEFQDLVAAMLRGMGYSTPFVAPKGPDGGTDIIAYRDPLGIEKPHVRVQAKHRRNTKASREEIASLRGVIRQDREIGMFVSSAGFTPEATREARQGAVHIELIDLERFLELWIAHYDRLSEEDKGRLRLRKVHFLAPED